MTAQLARANDHTAAGVEEVGSMRRGIDISHSTSDNPQVCSMQIDCGYLSPYFVTDPERMEVAFEKAYVLICEKKISSRKDLFPLLEQITKSGRPLLIIAEDVGGEALAALVVNKLRGPLRIAAVRVLGLGDQGKNMLQKIALLTGGRVITEGRDIQLSDVQIPDLGQAKKIIIDKNNTTVEGKDAHNQFGFGPELNGYSNAHTSPPSHIPSPLTADHQ